MIWLQEDAKCILLLVAPFLAIANIVFHWIFELQNSATGSGNYNRLCEIVYGV